jgi:DNA-binding NtrC family response regulator
VQKQKPRVLLVDDDPDVLRTYGRLLQKSHPVALASSGPEGLAVLEREPSIEVVISDMRMPVMDGAEFLRLALARSPGLVCILLSGFADVDAVIQALRGLPIFRSLSKPCAPQKLLEVVGLALERYAALAG